MLWSDDSDDDVENPSKRKPTTPAFCDQLLIAYIPAPPPKKPVGPMVPGSLGLGRYNVNVQGIMRNRQENLLFLDSDDYRNTLQYEVYRDFLKSDRKCEILRLAYGTYCRDDRHIARRISLFRGGHNEDVTVDVDNEDDDVEVVLNDVDVENEGLERMDVQTLRDGLTYLIDEQSSLLSHGDFITVGEPPRVPLIEPDRSLACALAGIVGMDLFSLYRVALSGCTSTDAHGRLPPLVDDEILLNRCRAGKLILYETSERLIGAHGIDEYLREYVKNTAERQVRFNRMKQKIRGVAPSSQSSEHLILCHFGNKQLRAEKYEPGSGHAFVLRFSLVQSMYPAYPQKVLIDFQQPGLLYDFITPFANPLRFTPYVDTATYSEFVIHAVMPLR